MDGDAHGSAPGLAGLDGWPSPQTVRPAPGDVAAARAAAAHVAELLDVAAAAGDPATCHAYLVRALHALVAARDATERARRNVEVEVEVMSWDAVRPAWDRAVAVWPLPPGVPPGRCTCGGRLRVVHELSVLCAACGRYAWRAPLSTLQRFIWCAVAPCLLCPEASAAGVALAVSRRRR